MWEALPIQHTGMKGGEPMSTIHANFPYPAYPDVCCKKWRDVDVLTQKWAMSLWCVHFGIRRCPLGPDDLFLWIPYVATLTAKLGAWRDGKEIKMAFVGCNYVDPAHRGKGLAQHMILTMAHALSPRHKFMFELQTVPPSLDDATPFLRFFYVWIPMLFKGGYVETAHIDARGIPGFHPDSWEGYRMFRNAEGQRVLVDPHDDIVWSDGYAFGFDGPSSRYVRWFSPYGNIRVYAQNVYFSDPDYARPALSG
jgi:hypothetical protein